MTISRINSNISSNVNSAIKNVKNIANGKNTTGYRKAFIIIAVLILCSVLAFILYFVIKKEKKAPCIPKTTSVASKHYDGKQVFNISNNIFTYKQAQEVCKAYNGELATIEQVLDAYNHGASWCNYGWSKNQMALYPIQKGEWLKLQDDPIYKNSCGVPGVNGGYFADGELNFGINCYGIKPKQTPAEKVKPDYKNILGNRELKKIKAEIGEFTILPFNHNEWSEY